MSVKGLGYLLRCLVAAFLLATFHAHAQPQSPPVVNVYDDGISFTPDPVYIVTGEAVSWTDDGTGYTIISDSGSWNSFQIPGGILFTDAGTYQYLDDAGDTGTIYVTPNIPPTVTITSPTNQMSFTSAATIDFSADGGDTDADGLYSVQLWLGPNLLAEVFSAPFTTTIANLPVGSYVLTAIAYDNVGAAATNQINITIAGGGGGNPPIIALAAPRLVAGTFQFDVSGLVVGKTNLVETLTDLSSTNWVAVATNIAASSSMTFTNSIGNNAAFFQVIQLP